MNTQNGTKINELLRRLPNGVVATTKWLRSTGVGLSLTTAYVRTGWFDRVGVGAVSRRGCKVDWSGAVYALQSQLGLSTHPGGKTALGLLGSLHYIPLGSPPVVLFGRTRENLPEWFTQHDWSAPIEMVNTDLFADSADLGMSSVEMGDFALRVSSNERAMMECLYLLKRDNPGDESVKIMEGLAWLRPEVVQQLLEACRSAKVKRLFLVLAERANHPWLRRLDLKRVDIGKGKRQFVQGGHMHPHYHITVPKSWRRTETVV